MDANFKETTFYPKLKKLKNQSWLYNFLITHAFLHYIEILMTSR
jgi:hypothetical protein